MMSSFLSGSSVKRVFILIKGFTDKPIKNITKKGDAVLQLQDEVIALKTRLNALLQKRKHGLSILKKIHEETLLHGESARLSKFIKGLDEDETKYKKKAKKLEESIVKVEEKLKVARSIYDSAINHLGKVWVIGTFAAMAITILAVANTRTLIGDLNPELKLTIDTFALNIDPKFYELTVQILLALSIALFVKNDKYDAAAKINWWGYSKFAMGVTSSLTGMATCLYVVGGNKPGIYTFSLVMVCLLILLTSALRPLLRVKR